MRQPTDVNVIGQNSGPEKDSNLSETYPMLPERDSKLPAKNSKLPGKDSNLAERIKSYLEVYSIEVHTYMYNHSCHLPKVEMSCRVRLCLG